MAANPPRLPEHHLALVVEDALAAVDAAPARSSAPRPAPDLRAVLLYGWAVGLLSAGDVVRREEVDAGLRYLLRGTQLSAEELRAFREQHAAALEAVYGRVFDLCLATGMTSLGTIWLGDRTSAAGGAPFTSWLARQALASAAAADAHEQAEPGSTYGEPLPGRIATRAGRQAAFRSALATPLAITPVRRPAPPPRRGRLGPAPSAVAVLALLVVGLVLVRWLAVVTAPPPVRATAAAHSPLTEPVTDPLSFSAIPAPSATPSEDLEMTAAHDEAFRLAQEALEDDDLATARSFYVLALAALPDDDEAADRLRQVETAQGIGDRRDGWSAALADLTDLRELAPDSATVLRAYVAALVGAGREALADRDLRRAGDLCGEANRWFPDRADARLCLSQSGFAPTSTPIPTPRPAATAAPPTATRITGVLSTTVPEASTAVPASPTAVALSTAPPTAITAPPAAVPTSAFTIIESAASPTP